MNGSFLVLCGALPLLALLSCGSRESASLILIARRIHTLDPSRPQAEAVAIREGRLIAVGSRAEVLAYKGPKTELLELPGVAFPGLTDAHAHLASLGAGLEQVELRGSRSLEEVVERVAAAAAALPPGTWVRGRGWDQTLWPETAMPLHHKLSARTPEHPVWLVRVDGHAALANARALSTLDPATPDPPGGKILRDPDGAPTGVFIDNAMELIAARIPPPTEADLERRLLLAQEKCLGLGLTRIHDAWSEPHVRVLLRRLEAEGRWHLGLYGMLPTPAPGQDPPAPEDPGPASLLRFRALKLFADGALGSRGAALLAPYGDEPGNTGLLTTPETELRRLVAAARDKGLQPCVHAIGDRANRLMLDAYEQQLSPADRKRLRPRIEHAQVLAPADLPRFARLGVLASMQPTHLTSDMPWAPLRLGPERAKNSYAFATLLASGAPVCFGSDFPVEPPCPLAGLFAALTTIPPETPTAAPLRPDQRLDFDQALAGFTSQAAYAAFEEGVRGRIAKGFVADLTILDRDIAALPPEELLQTKVLAVVVGTYLHIYDKTAPK